MGGCPGVIEGGGLGTGGLEADRELCVWECEHWN